MLICIVLLDCVECHTMYHGVQVFINKCMVQLNISRFMIHDEILDFHDWLVCCHEPFHDPIKR